MAQTYTGYQLAKKHEEKLRGRQLWGGALMTSGSFTTMAAQGTRRQLWAGALMTSGSFTMMAAAGM